MGSEKKKILVIDDNSDIRNLIQYIFEKAGLIVIHGENGESGLAALNACRPDLVFLDVTMPGISGLEVLREIRRNPDDVLRSVPVMMLSANSSEDEIEQALALGASSYIVKPFKRDEIIAHVNLMLQLEEV